MSADDLHTVLALGRIVNQGVSNSLKLEGPGRNVNECPVWVVTMAVTRT